MTVTKDWGRGAAVGEVAAALDAVERQLDGLGTGAIPRTIHQTYFSATLPPALSGNVDALRALNPGWSFSFYDDAAVERFIAEEYGKAILARYLRISPKYGAARADLFRYLLIFRSGGVYLDIKSSADQPFDEVLRSDDRFIISQWDNGINGIHPGGGLFHPELAAIPHGEFQQWHIIAAPGHPFLRAVIERVLHAIDTYNPYRVGVGLNVLRVTGPIPYTLAIAPLLACHPHRRVRDERALGLRYTILGGEVHRRHLRGHYSRRRTPIVGADRGWIANAPLLGFIVARSLVRRAIKRLKR
ncbi:glycosyltransferase [Sphingomonas sp. HHU CXW]|uniref:Glycosyltransferase n=1 Tax=Sphingomonas hominis TaxID=2741495 RepID=A0ABX2JJQ5_9SPHN|nr:glycosyltransferase [Sphingomonas hominis]NTS66801.1 glycosyltransferase [Sphingomonas hominis]